MTMSLRQQTSALKPVFINTQCAGRSKNASIFDHMDSAIESSRAILISSNHVDMAKQKQNCHIVNMKKKSADPD